MSSPSSASQVTAAKKKWTLYQGYQDAQDKQQTQYQLVHRSKWKIAPSSLKIPSECPDFWMHLPKHEWLKSWSSMEDAVFLLERNLYGHPLARLLCERQFEKILLKHGWEKIPNCECLFVHREKGLFLSVYVDDVELTGKKRNIDPIWKSSQQRSRFGRTNIFPWIMYTWAALKDNVK